MRTTHMPHRHSSGSAFVILGLILALAIALAVSFASFLTIAAAHAADLPTPDLTPGAINPAVTQDNIQQTICVRGYTKTIRPPEKYTSALKRKQLEGYTDKNPRHYEEDHLISLEIGGHPSDPKNLWPEAYAGTWNAHVKDKLENRLHAEVCAGRLTLEAAQHAISVDWIAAYRHYFGDPQ